VVSLAVVEVFLVVEDELHLPNSDWQPFSTEQWPSSVPHQPYWLQHSSFGHLPTSLPHLPLVETGMVEGVVVVFSVVVVVVVLIVVVIVFLVVVVDFLVVEDESHLPNSDWQPLATEQWPSSVPHQPYLLQHSSFGHLPTSLPHLPLVETGMVEGVVVVFLVVVVVVVVFLVVVDFLVVEDESHLPNSDWQPLATEQWPSSVPHQPYLLQHSSFGHLPTSLPHLPLVETGIVEGVVVVFSVVVVVVVFLVVVDFLVVEDELHLPNSDWQPLATEQWPSSVPHQPYWLQHSFFGHLPASLPHLPLVETGMVEGVEVAFLVVVLFKVSKLTFSGVWWIFLN